jgi:putative holliday junction resolvase
MRRGVRIGVDPGTVRIGVAASDPDGILATPVETVRRGAGDAARIRQIAAERGAIEVVVGLPRSLRGHKGQSAAYVAKFARELSRILAPVPVRLSDERLSTTAAQARLRESGVRGRRARALVDQEAAVVILQSALDIERSTGNAPGEIVPPAEAVE